MSNSRRSEDDENASSPVDRIDEWYHVPALALLMAFMLWVRTRSYDRFVRDGGVFFSGNDPYYHLREVTYTVNNWPATIPFDPWTNFPYGTSVGQFGTLFDQIIATAALVVGLGDPSGRLVAETLLVAPAVFGTAIAVPMYLIGRRLGGRFGGLFGVAVLALLPGEILRRSLVGGADHQVAEALFQAIAVLGILVALSVAEREKPVYELILDRDFEALRKPVGYGALAGVGMALYLWTWPPGVLLLAIVAVFFTVKLSATYLNGNSPEPLAFAGATSMAVVGVLTLLPLNTLSFSPTSFSLLQPAVAFATAAGAVFVAWLAREWDDRSLDRRLFPVTIFALIGVGLVFVAVLLPDVWGMLVANFKRFLGFSAAAQSRTIGEAQPFLSRLDRLPGVGIVGLVMREYGVMFFVALVTAGYVLLRPLVASRDTTRQGVGLGALVLVGLVWQFDFGGPMADLLPLIQAPVLWELFLVGAAVLVVLLLGDHDPVEMFVVVWALFITAAAFTQVRFNYYLALVVVALTAYAVGRLLDALGVIAPDGRIRTDIEPYQVMALMLALLVVVPGLVVPVQVGGSAQRPITTNQAWEAGNSTAPSAAVQWNGLLEWMQNETPREGELGGADNRMAYYGTYGRPADGDYRYPDGSYGVMSWWDYGHWITVNGERIPNANPFQQGATTAANFLLAPNESQANGVLDGMSEDDEPTRYVMVDWKMVQTMGGNAKFFAPTVFYDADDVSRNDFTQPLYLQTQEGTRQATTVKSQRYYRSLMVRLYHFHGSAAQPEPYVLQWGSEGEIPETGQRYKLSTGDQPLVKEFRTVQQARAYARNNTNAQVGGFGVVPPEYVPALQHYRLVKVSESSATSSGDYVRQVLTQLRTMRNASQDQFFNHPQWVKTFERVPGATLVGTNAPPNSTVQVSVRMRMTTTNETFTYTQRAQSGPDGRFELTVPYSTEGYSEFGPENGYTNVSVRAVGPYQVSGGFEQLNNSTYVTWRQSVNVSEAQVLGVDESDVRFELNRTEFEIGQPPTNNSSTGNETTPPANETDDDATGNETADNETTNTSSVGLTAAPGTAEDVRYRKAPERDPWSPVDGAARGGVLLVLLAGLAVETRD